MTMATSTMSSPSRAGVSSRKTNKPLMEKRRRARINECLSQLKSLVIQSSKKDSSQFNKLEKADILELTVKHLRNLQSQQQHEQMSATSEHSLTGKYQAGFMECANEVIRYLGQSQGFSDDIKARVVGHLASCIQLASKSTFTKPTQQNIPQGNNNAVPANAQPVSTAQLSNGQIIQLVNASFHQMKPQGLNQYSSAPVQISPPASTQAPRPSSTESSPYIRITQPLHIQIPTVLSPVLVQTKAPTKLPQPSDSHLNVKQEKEISPTIVQKELSVSPAPLRLTKHNSYYPQEDEYTRSRTYSMTSSSSESEMTSPLNLSQSPEYYESRRDSGYAHSRYPSPHQDYHQTLYDKLSPVHYKPDSGLYTGHYSNFTSVIVDGRKSMLDSATYKYMTMDMEEDRHCLRHEGSTSPASSVGEERLWRPW